MTPLRAEQPPFGPAFELVAAKLRPPVTRSGIVPRTALVDRLLATPDPPVIAVVAPAGYGKTTLLAQWAARKAPRVAWVSADDRDNDPSVLLTYIAAALDAVEPLGGGVFRTLASPAAAVAGPRQLVAALGGLDAPVALVLDHVETLSSRACQDAVAALALGLPPGSQLALGSRDTLPIPAARLRAQGGLVEVGADDLAMAEHEVLPLLAGAGVDIRPDDVRTLVERTEGWPVGLYLAALAATAGSPRTPEALTVGGDDRFVGDYLRAEILDRVSPDQAAFLTRTSILDIMSGPLCDAVLDTTRSAWRLEELEDRNLLVVPLDHRRETYRYHHLFRELLAAELRRREPEAVQALHLRAATWCEENRQPETAIAHAQAAGDADRVARLVLRLANPVWATGRADTVLRWMRWFEDQGLVASYPGIAAHGALMFALMGRPGETERWSEAAEQSPVTGVLDDGNTVEATAAYLRALLCRDGVGQMRADAATALAGLGPASPYRATMIYTEAVADLLDGEFDRADAGLVHALDAAVSAGVAPFVPVVLAERGILAAARDEWDDVDVLADRAEAAMAGGQFDDYWTSALVYAWLARVALRRGDVGVGRDHVGRAARLRGLLTYALPVVSVQALLEMARAYIALADPAGGWAVLRQVRDILQQRPKLGHLPAEADDLRARLDTMRGGAPGASSLTTAELRLLPLLPTHLTFPEIGERLYVSRHTVKTQAMSVYRKLGVSSRSEAIARMRELGLLAHA